MSASRGGGRSKKERVYQALRWRGCWFLTGEHGEVVAALRSGDGQRARAAVVYHVLVTRERSSSARRGASCGMTPRRRRKQAAVLRAPRGLTRVSELPLIAAAWPSPGAQPA